MISCIEDLLAAMPETAVGTLMRRMRAELAFAWQFASVFPEFTDEWRRIVSHAVEAIAESGEGAISEVEALLAPVANRAKGYIFHCCGHAHIDMDWTWTRCETIATCHDTFLTLDRLMDEYPELTFAQSQISIYKMMEESCPEVFEMIRRRMAEGRWQVTAGSWVEGDKNMASGESLCRHVLYSKRWLKDHLGLDQDAVRIDWQPDTFGHPNAMPAILTGGGITRYYRCRPETGPWLVRWHSPDGSTVVAFRDKGWYNKGWWEHETSPENMGNLFVDYLSENNLKDFLWIHGIGDHGGGPTREELNILLEAQTWPCFPTIKHSTVDEYFEAVESQQNLIAVHHGDFNTVFEGCYTSQSRIKKINRASESILPEAEAISVLANSIAGLDYPADQLRKAWELALFNQFHDILAGSSGHAAMEESVARFREIEAITGSVKMRALRRIASRVDTMSVAGSDAGAIISANGVGDVRTPGGVSTWSSSNDLCEPLVVFNPLPFGRSEMVMTKVWNKDWKADKLVVVDEHGTECIGQVVGTSSHVAHKALNVIFPAVNVPALGYKTYVLKPGNAAAAQSGVSVPVAHVMENEFLRVEVDERSGAISSLICKETGKELVPDGELMAVLEMSLEVPHGMTAWQIGEFERSERLLQGKRLSDEEAGLLREGDSLGMVSSNAYVEQNGPNRACIKTLHELGSSKIILEIGLAAGSRGVEINVIAEWREIGSPEIGVPVLRMLLPTDIVNPGLLCETPFGSLERLADGREVPSQRWIDLSGDRPGGGVAGITLVNDCKYGFGADGNVLRATLLRSTYDPDPYPEIGRHSMKFALYPHEGECSRSGAAKLSASSNMPMSVVPTEVHKADMPPSQSFVEVMTPGVELAAMKLAEDSDDLVLRLRETEGLAAEARIRLRGIVKPGSNVGSTDLLERAIPERHARMDGDILVVQMPANGIVTVAISR